MKHPTHTAVALHPPRRRAAWFGLLAGLALMTLWALLASPARAQDSPQADPPDRVGRLSDLTGQVWIYAPESNEWIAASRNRPVTTGDRLSTEADGRAEIRIGSSVLRVDGNTELEVLQLDDDHLSLHLHSGSVTARLRTREAADEFGLATDEGRFRTERTGSYRFDRIDDTSAATVTSGQVRYESEGTALTVQPGQRVEFWKSQDRPEYSVTDPKRDGFSDWVASREQREERSVSTRYVSPEMTGVEDLDRYGRWDQSPEYGAVWYPRTVVAGWAPYRMGHWAWVSPWGWTWVDDAPWGFAPFHYGRWVWYRDAWCWAPGRYVRRPVYAPALVAWVGGPQLSVSISVGRAPSVGWFPLGPHEVYVPGYRVSPRYVREVNVTHVTNINVTNIINSPNQVMRETRYVNRGIPHAVTVVPSSVIERRQPVAPAITQVNDRVLRDMVRERPRVEPPVAAPPRMATPGTRRIEDPRTGRENVVPAPGGAQAVVPPSPRWQRGGAQPSVGERGQRPDRIERVERPAAPTPSGQTPGDLPTVRVQPPAQQEAGRERHGRDVQGAVGVPAVPSNQAPPVANAPPPQAVQVNPGAQHQPGRVLQPQPRDPVSSPREGRGERHNEMPGPPRTSTQAPQPAPAPVAPPPVQAQPQPRPQFQAPPPAVVQQPRREAQPEVRRQEQRNERAVERVERNERQDRGERGERR